MVTNASELIGDIKIGGSSDHALVEFAVLRDTGQAILPLCSDRVRPHLESCVQLRGPQHRTDMDLLEQVQRRSEGWNTSAMRTG